MSAVANIGKWVEKKPMILIRFDSDFSDSLLNSRQGFEHLTIVKPHSVFQDFKLPTLCLLEIQEDNGVMCYLSTVTRKTAVSTFDSRLTIKKLRPVIPSSLQEIERNFSDTRMKHLFKNKVPMEDSFSLLSPKLSAHLIELLAQYADNKQALDVALSLLPKLRPTPNIN